MSKSVMIVLLVYRYKSHQSSSQPFSSDRSPPPNRKFRADLANAPSSKGKHKSPDEASSVKEDVRRMVMEADALRCAALGSREAIPFLPLMLV